MALTTAQYATHAMRLTRRYLLRNPEDIGTFLQEAALYATLGVDERDAVRALLTLLWPTLTPHERRHKLYDAGIVNAVDVPDVEEPAV